jgi:hypothetical protein
MKLRLRVNGSSLECSDESGTKCWSLPIEAIVLISEYTTDEGPWLDDYFLVFVTVEEDKLYFSTCSFYVDGRDEVIAGLEERLGSPIKLGLTNSTDWKSRVIWPPELADIEYFTFKEVPPQSLREKARKWLLGPTLEYSISRPARDHFHRQLAIEPVKMPEKID